MRSDLTLLPVRGAPAAGLTDALTSAAGYALSEKAAATRRAYRADIRHFTTWCEGVGAIALPATPAVAAAHLAALADSGLKVPTISRRAAAIAYAHKLAGPEPPINESVKAVMRGVRRRHCERSEAIYSGCATAGLLRRFAPRNDGPRRRARRRRPLRSWRGSSSAFPTRSRASATRR